VASGHEIEWFSAAFPDSKSEEDLDGVHIVRAGRQWTVHAHAFRRYHRQLRRRFDLVIDEVNTIPFFTPLWSEIPVFMLIYQLAREVWWYESPFPINLLGFTLEPLYLRVYRRVPVFTESNSTQTDLRKLGFKGSITVLPVGADPAIGVLAPKAAKPTFLYVGRLASSKRVGDIVRAFAIFKNGGGQGRLWIVGSGSRSYTRSLETLAHRLGVECDVEFCGRLSISDRNRRMAEAHVLLMASVREGWGLVVKEASVFGTPALVYDVPGLRDAVHHLRTGLVVPPSPTALAGGMLQLFQNRTLLERLSVQAAHAGNSLSFDHTATAVEAVLSNAHRTARALAETGRAPQREWSE
jgi:glycosyltransferase involved in cell wall biosynthesis